MKKVIKANKKKLTTAFKVHKRGDCITRRLSTLGSGKHARKEVTLTVTTEQLLGLL